MTMYELSAATEVTSTSDEIKNNWLTKILKWWNNLGTGWQIGLGGIVLVGSIIAVVGITVLSGGLAAPVLIGAIIGGIAGAGVSSVMQLLTTGTINPGLLAVDTISGAILGAFGGSTISLGGIMAVSGITGFVSSVAGDLVSGNDPNLLAAAAIGTLGAIISFSGGAGAQHGKTAARQAALSSKKSILAKNAAGGYKQANHFKGALRFNGWNIANSTRALSTSAMTALTKDIGKSVGTKVIEFLMAKYIVKYLLGD